MHRNEMPDHTLDLRIDQFLRHDGRGLGIGWSSSDSSTNFTFCRKRDATALASSMARRAPLSLSLPRCAAGGERDTGRS